MTQPTEPHVHGLIPEKQNRNSIADWVDSAALKLLQQVVTLILLPAAVWGLNVVVEKLGKIDERLAKGEISAATIELRLQQADRTNDAQAAMINQLEVRLRTMESEMRAIHPRR
jgi:hypothetical protein